MAEPAAADAEGALPAQHVPYDAVGLAEDAAAALAVAAQEALLSAARAAATKAREERRQNALIVAAVIMFVLRVALRYQTGLDRAGRCASSDEALGDMSLTCHASADPDCRGGVTPRCDTDTSAGGGMLCAVPCFTPNRVSGRCDEALTNWTSDGAALWPVLGYACATGWSSNRSEPLSCSSICRIGKSEQQKSALGIFVFWLGLLACDDVGLAAFSADVGDGGWWMRAAVQRFSLNVFVIASWTVPPHWLLSATIIFAAIAWHVVNMSTMCSHAWTEQGMQNTRELLQRTRARCMGAVVVACVITMQLSESGLLDALRVLFSPSSMTWSGVGPSLVLAFVFDGLMFLAGLVSWLDKRAQLRAGWQRVGLDPTEMEMHEV